MELETQAAFDPASFEHIPVLLNECLEGLSIDPAGTYLDGTAGGAGHSRQIALRLDAEKGGRLISLDQDPDAVQTARARLAGLPATVVQINFRYAGQALESLGIDKVNGALLDLGVSSHQLDDAARGFSYRADAPLDMRMSQEGETAADLVNSESREELARVMGMSVPDMARKFKEEFGESVYSWLLKQKNARILAMLSYPSVTIKDVIYEFKFSSPASFNKYCKTHFGCPPRVLAERIKNEKSAEYAAG